MMRYWSLVLLILLIGGKTLAQDNAPTQSVLFLARDDTDQDGQVTDADNMRLYEVGLDGTVLFVTPPDLHILDYALSVSNPLYSAAVIAQTVTDDLHVQVYDSQGALAIDMPLKDTAYIAWMTWKHELIYWASQPTEGKLVFTTLDPASGAVTTQPELEHASEGPETPGSPQTLTLDNEPFLLQETLTDTLLIVQHIGSEPADALWIYDRSESRLTPFSAWLYTEPLLLATHPQGPRIALLVREFDGSMSLYTVDLSTGVPTPQVTQVLSGLIDPPYTAIQWTSDGSSLLLVGESGDFVVSNIGRIEAVYALTLSTGAFTRLSPEGTLVERASISSH
jgi:hypothetical protein